MRNPPLVDTYINEASKSNGENYVNWKFKMMTMLESCVVDCDEDEPRFATAASGPLISPAGDPDITIEPFLRAGVTVSDEVLTTEYSKSISMSVLNMLGGYV